MVDQLADIKMYISRVSDFYETENGKKFVKYLIEQDKKEERIVKTDTSRCPYESLERKVTPDMIRTILKEGYGDSNILRTLMCVSDSILKTPNTGASILKVRKYLGEMTQIGAESVSGYAMLSKGDFFVVKSPRKVQDSYQEMNHEYFVGIYGTNTLRNNIPNFSYVFASFVCSPPYLANSKYWTGIGDKKKTATYCGGVDNKVLYLLYENVANSKTFHSFSKTATLQEFLNVLCQVILALDYAYKEIGFTHYDLHGENVLVRDIGEEIYIPYEVNGRTMYLKTNKIATIIDYGKSRILYNKESYGILEPIGATFPTVGFPLHDIYKLVGFSLHELLGGVNNEVYDRCKYLLDFFSRIDNYEVYLKDAREFYFTLPYSKDLISINPITFYNDALVVLFPDIINGFLFDSPVDDSVSIYGCFNNKTCLNLTTAINRYTTYYMDVYDAYNTRPKSRDMMIERSKEYFSELANDYNGYMNSLEDLFQNYSVRSFFGTTNSMLFSAINIEAYRSHVAKTVKIQDSLNMITVVLEVYDYIYDIIPDKNNLIRDRSKLDRYNTFIEEAYEEIRLDAEEMKEKYSDVDSKDFSRLINALIIADIF